MPRIPSAVARRLGYYVYGYVHPRTRRIFYVGKGRGQRMLWHLSARGRDPKVRAIARLRAGKLVPRIDILAHGLAGEETAFRVEAAVIDALGLDGLTNRVRGWGTGLFGRLPLSELVDIYAAQPVKVRHPVLLIRINRLYKHGMTRRELYDVTRGVWRLGTRREKARYAFAVFEGVVKDVTRLDAGTPPVPRATGSAHAPMFVHAVAWSSWGESRPGYS